MNGVADRHILVIGLGYSARAFAARALADGGARVSGTSRQPMNGGVNMASLDNLPADITDLVVSAPPPGPPDGCPPALPVCSALRPQWIGYLSSTAVYGDCGGGAWIDEGHPPPPPRKARTPGRVWWPRTAGVTSPAARVRRWIS